MWLKFCLKLSTLKAHSQFIFCSLTALHHLIQIWYPKAAAGDEGGSETPCRKTAPERSHTCSDPQSQTERVFLSLCRSFFSYHTVGTFLSFGGASSLSSSCLCLLLLHRLQDMMITRRMTTTAIPPPMPSARRTSSENEAVGEKETWDYWNKMLSLPTATSVLIELLDMLQTWLWPQTKISNGLLDGLWRFSVIQVRVIKAKVLFSGNWTCPACHLSSDSLHRYFEDSEDWWFEVGIKQDRMYRTSNWNEAHK